MMSLRILPMVVLIALLTAAKAEEQQPSHPCNPWPNCQLDRLVINPGAPNTGLRPQGRPGLQMQDAAPNQERGSLRLPSNTSTMSK
jgi:hypothetical protein